MTDLKIFASPLPFSNKQIEAYAPVGSTIQEIVDQVNPDRFKKFDKDKPPIGAIVYINGEVVLRQHWPRVKPKPGTVINVRIVPLGGGGGKNPLATILSIAVMIAAPYAGAAIAAATGGWIGATFYGTALISSVASAAVGVVGRLLVTAIAPPPKPSNFGSVSNPTESPTQFIEGANNVMDPYGVVPVCLGVNRMVPPQAARIFPETVSDDQFVRQLFTWGYGNKVVVSDLRIADTSLDEFTDFQVEHRLEGDLHLGTALYSDDYSPEPYTILLQQVDSWTTRTTHANVDEAIVDFTFFQGLTRLGLETGKRNSLSVQLELQYTASGGSVWSTGATAYTAYSGAGFTIQPVTLTGGVGVLVGYRKDIIGVDILSGAISIYQGAGSSATAAGAAAPTLPVNVKRLSTVVVQSVRVTSTSTSVVSYTDDRQAADFGTVYQSAGDFAVSIATLTVTVAAGHLKAAALTIITGAQVEALRKSFHVRFPSRGTYDIRVRRVSADTSDDHILDKVTLSGITGVTHSQPVVLEGINGTAVRIKGTEQLNGALSQFNGLVGSVVPDYNSATAAWEDAVSSNPASLYLYVLQGAANARPLGDTKINFDDFVAWHAHCITQGYTYNRVIDYETSVDEVLRDIAAAGSASPALVDGKRTIAIDKVKSDIVQMVTPRNSWGYSASFIYPDLPHAFRVQFRNSNKGYLQDEVIVYDDGYNEGNATKFETLELQSCTNSDLAFKTGRRHIAAARLRPEIHSFMMDVENLVFLRGNRIVLEHDIPVVGVGDARIKTVLTSGSNVTGFTMDDIVTIPNTSPYYARVRLADGTWLYKQIVASIGSHTSFNFVTPFAIIYDDQDVPQPLFTAGDLCYVVETGGEVDLIITRIEPQDDLSARITAIDYAPDIFVAESASIPPFTSNITTPLEFSRPLPPTLVSAQSDEGVMLRNSDGSLITRAVFVLANPNEGDMTVSVKIRPSGTDAFSNANVLEASPERLVLTGLQDDTSYDIHIRYKRPGSTLYSIPLQLNSYLFEGAIGIPADVTGFEIDVSGTTALFKWDANEDIDLSHYIIKFSGIFFGATWATSQVLEPFIYGNRISLPFQGGTYLIKAVDYLGNESENATAIITYDDSGISNSVAVLDEAPDFLGTKDNVLLEGTGIVLEDTDLITGYYYFYNDLDLGAVYTSIVSASVVASGIFVNDIFEITDVFAETDIFGSGGNDVFAMGDVFTEGDFFGIGADSWSVELQYRVTNDDPTGAPTWTAWAAFISGSLEFRAIEFRILLTSLAENVSPKITALSVTIDMPDRIERGSDLTVPAGGATIVFDPAFKITPAIVITVQDGATDDRIEFTAKTSSGFTFKVYNATLAGYVSRTYDYIASGYGRST